MADVFGHPLDACTTQVGAPPPGDLGREISRPTGAGRARIRPANAAATATLGRRILLFPGHSRPAHISLSPFFDPLNSFSWSFSSDSSPFERYDDNKFGRRLIEFFGHHRNFWTKVRVLLCSWSLEIFVDINFVNFGRRLVSFPFLGHLG